MRNDGWYITGGIAVCGLILALAAPARADVEAGVKKYQVNDYAGAIAEWLPFAAQNDPAALYNLGQVYRLGRGVDADVKRAAGYYERAARFGHIGAMSNLASLYYFSTGELRDTAAAMMWWQAAAKAGDARARYMLGILYFNGQAVARDWPRAYALTSLAADTGLPEAQSSLIQMRKHLDQTDIAAADALRRDLSPALFGNDTPLSPSTSRIMLASQSLNAGPINLPAVSPAAPPPSVAAQAPAAPKPLAVKAAPVPLAALPPTPPPPVARSAAATGWRVQVGAFAMSDGAQRAWSDLQAAQKSQVAGLAPVYVPAGRVTKLQLAGFADRAAAQALCDRLSAAGQGCYVTSAAP